LSVSLLATCCGYREGHREYNTNKNAELPDNGFLNSRSI